MQRESPVIDIEKLVRRFGRTDAVDGLDLRVEPGRCYGLFGHQWRRWSELGTPGCPVFRSACQVRFPTVLTNVPCSDPSG